MPDGIRWNFHFSPSRTIVWPALLPPWKRITRSARSAIRSVTLPLPSSPHWAPTITMPAIGFRSLGGWLAVAGGRGERADLQMLGDGSLARLAVVRPVEGERVAAADLHDARHRALADLLLELFRVEVRGQQQRPLLLVAVVDDRVQLL